MFVQNKRVAERFLREAMSNLRAKTTGVAGTVIWVSAGEFSGASLQHGPRIKVMLGDKITTEGLENAATVMLTDPPKIDGVLPADVKLDVLKFTQLNRDVLLAYWRKDIDTKEMLDGLEPV